MVKGHLNLSVDEELANKGRERMLNFSELFESALKEKLNFIDVVINEAEECEYCSRRMPKATKEEINGLVWLYPWQEWVCPTCMKQMASRVPVVQASKK